MADRPSQERLFLSPPHVSEGEREALLAAFDSNYIAPVGPHLDLFEERFREKTGFAHCVAVSSGTAAMHLALRNLGVGPGDVVIASTLTFIGSVSPILFQGATPLFVDSSLADWNMDPELLGEAIERVERSGRRVAAVVPTDLYGQSCDLSAIRSICEERAIPLVVDCAESLGATYAGKSVGKGAAAAVFSFNGNKILTTSGGGILASDDESMVKRARHLSTQAREAAAHFEHREIGYNYRLSNLCAAVGAAQLENLEARVEKKTTINRWYRECLADRDGISFMPISEKGTPNFWLTVIRVEEARSGASAEQIRLALEEENIESRPMWKPMHLQPVFAGCETALSGVSETLFATGLCLPSGTMMEMSDVERVASIIMKLCCGAARDMAS